MQRRIVNSMLLAAAIGLFSGCGGPATEPPGSNDTAGRSTMAEKSDLPAGDENCPAGGERIEIGIDQNGDNQLGPYEVTGVEYVCDGTSSLVSVETEPAGDHCAQGGQRLSAGTDLDTDGILDGSEILRTVYVCNGMTGASGPTSVSILAEPAGSNCAAGGQKILTGTDADGNGTIASSEIESTSYVCNGRDGDEGRPGDDAPILGILPEPPGTNCAAGGQRVATGMDDDRDGELDDGEVDSVGYVCNGGGGIGAFPDHPTARAGQDQMARERKPVVLDGSGSSDPAGQPLTYEWSVVSTPFTSPGVTLSSATVARPTFVPDTAGDYVFSLVVDNGILFSPPDFVRIRAQANRAPFANAGPDRVYSNQAAIGTPQSLDGSGSYDPEGDPITFQWAVSSVPYGVSGVTLSGVTAMRPTFVPPIPGDYRFSLVVHDGFAPSTADSVVVRAYRPPQPPFANAGPDRNVTVGSVTTVDGRGSSDPNGDAIVSYQWAVETPVGYSGANLGGATLTRPFFTFTPDAAGSFIFSLVVSDGTFNSTPDEVTVSAH